MKYPDWYRSLFSEQVTNEQKVACACHSFLQPTSISLVPRPNSTFLISPSCNKLMQNELRVASYIDFLIRTGNGCHCRRAFPTTAINCYNLQSDILRIMIILIQRGKHKFSGVVAQRVSLTKVATHNDSSFVRINIHSIAVVGRLTQ